MTPTAEYNERMQEIEAEAALVLGAGDPADARAVLVDLNALRFDVCALAVRTTSRRTFEAMRSLKDRAQAVFARLEPMAKGA